MTIAYRCFWGFAVSLILLFFYSCTSEQPVVTGKITNAKGLTVKLQYSINQQFVTIDSATIDDDGSFVLTRPVKQYGFYILKVSEKEHMTLVLDSSSRNISVTADAGKVGETYQLKGSRESEEFMQYFRFVSQNGLRRRYLEFQMDSLQRTFTFAMNKNKDQRFIDSLSKAIEPIFNEKQDAYRKLAKERADFSKTFIESHPSSIVSMVVISELQPALDYFDSYEKLEKSLKATGRKSDQLESFYQLVANMKTAYEQRKEQDRLMAENEKNLAIGVLAPEIKLKDPSGRVISSRDFKGKVLLIDFWASWCPPCRAANPELTELYKKHQGKGFEILGVSLDDKEMAWKQAIAMDKLSWPQVSDLGGWRSSVVPQYNIIQLPSSYLLDRNGKIIAKNLAGDSLELKVKTMLR